MKKIFPYLLLTFGISMSYITYGQNTPIEIQNRQYLPADVYTKLKGFPAIIIGEVHGNNESPQFVEGLVNLFLTSGEKVLLGLEINMDDQQGINDFLASGDFEALRKLHFFNRGFEDGRSSKAMAGLIQSCYKKNIKIVCLDAPFNTTGNMKRDSFMAANALNAISENRGWKLITLTGNAHNKMDKYYAAGTPYGYWLFNVPNTTLSNGQICVIDIVYERGTTWMCQGRSGECKEYPQGNYARDLATKTTFDNCFFDADGDKKFFTRVISASLPLNQ